MGTAFSETANIARISQVTDSFDNYCVVVVKSTGHFFQDVLFPYAKDNVQGFLERTWETAQCREDVVALNRQVHCILKVF